MVVCDSLTNNSIDIGPNVVMVCFSLLAHSFCLLSCHVFTLLMKKLRKAIEFQSLGQGHLASWS